MNSAKWQTIAICSLSYLPEAVMNMMRLMMEAVMVIAVVLVMVLLMKMNTKEDDSNTVLPDETDDSENND